MSAAILEQAAVLVRQRQGNAAHAYEALVARLASGADVPPEDVIAITEAAGIALDQLQDDLAKAEGLAAAHKELAEQPRLQKRIGDVEAERAKLKSEWESVQSRISKRDAELSAELDRLAAAAQRARDAQGAISSGKFDLQSAKSRRAAASAAISRVSGPLANLQTELARLRRELASLESSLPVAQKHNESGIKRGGPAPESSDPAPVQARIAATKNQIAQLEREAASLQGKLDEANAVLEALRVEQTA